jgi:hypothetical protein
MPLQHWQILDQDLYKLRRYLLLRQLEESGDAKESAYVDSEGIPTIGVGFNLRYHWQRVAAKMGVDLTESFDNQYRVRIENIVNATYPNTQQGNAQLQAQLNLVMAR